MTLLITTLSLESKDSKKVVISSIKILSNAILSITTAAGARNLGISLRNRPFACLFLSFRLSLLFWFLYKCQNLITASPKEVAELYQEPLALDGAVVPKISKRRFFQDIINSFQGATQLVLKPPQWFLDNVRLLYSLQNLIFRLKLD